MFADTWKCCNIRENLFFGGGFIYIRSSSKNMQAAYFPFFSENSIGVFSTFF